MKTEKLITLLAVGTLSGVVASIIVKKHIDKNKYGALSFHGVHERPIKFNQFTSPFKFNGVDTE